jgi:hypothetical protein
MWGRSSANLVFLTPVHDGKIVFKKHIVQLLKRGGGEAQKVQEACKTGASFVFSPHY